MSAPRACGATTAASPAPRGGRRRPIPFAQFLSLVRAGAAGEPDPTAMALATATPDGQPSVRMVLLKDVDAPRASSSTPTTTAARRGELDGDRSRQPAVLLARRSSARCASRARVERVTDAESDAYFATRPLESRWSAHASPQSRPIDSREALEARGGRACARSSATHVPRPAVVGRLPRVARRVRVLAGPRRTGCTIGCATSATTGLGAASGSRRRRRSELRDVERFAGLPVASPPSLPARPSFVWPVRATWCRRSRFPGTASGAGEHGRNASTPLRPVAVGGQPPRRRARVRAGLSPFTAADHRRRDARRRRRLRAGASRGRVRPRIGLSRFSLTQLAARIAAPRLAGAGIAPASALALEAVAARVGVRDGAPRRPARFLTPVAGAPGFPRALARTFGDLRLAGLSRADLSRPPATARACATWPAWWHEAERELDEAHVADRDAAVRSRARRRAGRGVPDASAGAARPRDRVAGGRGVRRCALVAARVARCWPRRRRRTETAQRVWSAAGRGDRAARGGRHGDLVEHPDAPLLPTRLRRARTSDGSFEFFSAPGEGRECVEIARRILREARRGVRLRRDGHPRPRAGRTTSGCSSTRSSEPACRRASSAARGGRIRPAGRSWRCSRAPPKVCRRIGSPSICRWASCPSADAPPPRWVPPGDELFPASAPRDVPAAVDDAAPDRHRAGHRRAAGHCGHAARAPAMGADAGRGRRHRRRSRPVAAPAPRARRGAAHAARGGAARRSRVVADGRRSTRDAALARASRRLCAASHRRRWRPGRGGRRGASGSQRFEQLAPRVLRAPAHVLRVLADLRPMAAVRARGTR